MKNIIGTAVMTLNQNSQISLKVYLVKDLSRILGDQIVFNYHEMIIRRPTIDNNVVHKTKGKSFSFMPHRDAEEFVGTYNVIQKDEDTFKLKRAKTCPKIQ